MTVSIGAPVANARIASSSSAYAAEQGGTFILMVNGSGFDSGSVVYWQGTALATQFASATKLTANVPSSDLATPGVVTIQVKSADVTGNSTNSLQFEVDSVSAASGSPVFPNPTQSVVAGGTAQYTATLPSTATNVSATCLNLPAGATCTYASSSGAVSITTTSATPAGTYQVTVVFSETLRGTASASALLFFLLISPIALRRRLLRRAVWICAAMVAIGVAGSVIGCSSSDKAAKSIDPSPAPTPTYQVTSSGTVTLTVQ